MTTLFWQSKETNTMPVSLLEAFYILFIYVCIQSKLSYLDVLNVHINPSAERIIEFGRPFVNHSYPVVSQILT